MFNKWIVSAALLVITLLAADTHAQTGNRLAVGMSLTSRIAGSSGTAGTSDVGFELRIGHEDKGWGWQESLFSWFDAGVEPKPGETSKVGDLRIRPLLLGYGYTWVRGRTTLTADVLGGYAFNSFHLDPDATTDLLKRGAQGIDTEATNTFAVKPEVQAWYDLSPRFGLKVDFGYLVARPSITIKSTLGDDRRDVNADSFLITVGVVYSIF